MEVTPFRTLRNMSAWNIREPSPFGQDQGDFGYSPRQLFGGGGCWHESQETITGIPRFLFYPLLPIRGPYIIPLNIAFVNGGVPVFWWKKPCFKWAKCIF